MRISTHNYGTMVMDDDKVATPDDINDIASSLLDDERYGRWTRQVPPDGIAAGDSVIDAYNKLCDWREADCRLHGQSYLEG